MILPITLTHKSDPIIIIRITLAHKSDCLCLSAQELGVRSWEIWEHDVDELPYTYQ